MQRLVKKGVLYAVLKGALDSGLNIPHNKNILPEESRVKGEHIINLGKINNLSSSQFTNYKKKGLNLVEITENFNQTKDNIIKNG